jgi:folate-binding Fe-S cluster repair protein YgfZ
VELNGVSFTKGCYVGQENTARMNWRQKVNRRLVVVPLARSAPIAGARPIPRRAMRWIICAWKTSPRSGARLVSAA